MAGHGPKCTAITLKGSRCKNNAAAGGALCAVHLRARKKLGELGKKGGGERPTLAALRFRDERGRLTSREGTRPDKPGGTPHTIRADAIKPGDVLRGFQVEKVEPGSKAGTVRIHVGNGVRILAPADRDVDILRGGKGGKPGEIPPAPTPTPKPARPRTAAVPSKADARTAVAHARTAVGDPAKIGQRKQTDDEELALMSAYWMRRQLADLLEHGDWDAIRARPVSTNPNAPPLDTVASHRRGDLLNRYRNNPNLRASTVAFLRASADGLIAHRDAETFDADSDRIPGPTTIAKVDAIRQAGAVLNRRIDARAAELAGTPEFDPKRAKTLQAALDAADATGDQDALDVAWTALREHQAKQRRTQMYRGRAQREILAEIRPMGGTIDYGPQVSVDGENTIDKAVGNFPSAWLTRATDGGPLDVVLVHEQAGRGLPSNSRGKFQGGDLRRITVLQGDTTTATHELTHLMETSVPGLRAAQWAYHAQRNTTVTRGQRRWTRGSGSLRPLADLVPYSAYRPDEVSRADKFTSPYAGKVYGDGGPGQHWEIASMGSESFASSQAVTRDDPHLRDFIIGLWAVL